MIRMKTAVGIPAYNEEKNIAKIIVDSKKIADHILVCDDGSTDSTAAIAESLGAIVVKHTKNLGYGSAIHSIFLKAKELDTDILVTIDADGQHRTEDIAKVVEPIKKGEAELVIGSRFLDLSAEKIPEYRKLGIKIITKVTNSSLKNKITDSQSGFRAYSKKVISELNVSDMGMAISTEILIKSSSLGFRIGEVPIKVLYGGDTSTHDPISHGTSVLFSTVKYTSIEHPLKFYGIPSIIFLIVGLSFTFLSIQYFTEIGRINESLTLIAAGTTLIGVILLITSILLYSLVSVVREKNTK